MFHIHIFYSSIHFKKSSTLARLTSIGNFGAGSKFSLRRLPDSLIMPLIASFATRQFLETRKNTSGLRFSEISSSEGLMT